MVRGWSVVWEESDLGGNNTRSVNGTVMSLPTSKKGKASGTAGVSHQERKVHRCGPKGVGSGTRHKAGIETEALTYIYTTMYKIDN